MKVLIIKNRYKKTLNWKLGIDYFSKNTPITIETEEISTDWDLTFRTVSNGTFTGCVVDNYYDKLRSVAPEGKYDVVCLVYGNDAPSVRVSITENTPLYKDCDVMQIVKETGNGKTFNHEMFHVLFYKLARKGTHLVDPMDTYKLNDDLDPNDDTNRYDALNLIKPYWDVLLKKTEPSIISKIMTAITPTTKYLYFKDSEIVGLKPELVAILDKARDLSGTSYIITSGFRDPAHNAAVGGVSNSAHLTGLAVDLACTDNFKRTLILKGLYTCGSPLFIEICQSHIHVDINFAIHQLGQTQWSIDD